MGNCRYFTEDMVDPIAVTAGLVQTALYLDFFYVYFTKYVHHGLSSPVYSLTCLIVQGSARTKVRAACMSLLLSSSPCPKIMYSRLFSSRCRRVR